MATSRAALATPRLSVHELACASPRSGKGPSRGGESTHVVFVRRGMFAAHVGTRRFLADPCTALVSWEGLEYQISHPCHGGDDCTVFELDAALADELLAGLEPRRDLELRLAPAHLAAYAAVHASLSAPTTDRLAAEEHALALVGTVAGASTRARTGTARRRIVQAAVELLNAELASSPSVSSIADAIGCSPYHLMHAFRAELGTTLRAYRLRLRIAVALHRLAAGEDLAALAADLGFASHAHFTGTFSRLLGMPPRSARTRMRTFLEARRASAT